MTASVRRFNVGDVLYRPFYQQRNRVFVRLRKDAQWNNNLVGQYAVLVRTTQDAAVDDGHFFTPDGQYWRNGLDGKAQLQEAIAIFNTIDEALEAVCEKLLSATRHIAFFKVQHHDHHPSCLILVEKLCLGVNPPEHAFEKESYRAADCTFDLERWCTSETA